jgi:hypothetical protein
MTLTLASATAAAWWAYPYSGYGLPYAAPSPQQMHDVAERQRTAVVEMMDAQRKAMDAYRPEMPSFADRYSMPELPAFGERPKIPARPKLPAMPELGAVPGYPGAPLLGARAPMPELPAAPAMPEFAMPEMPEMPEIPGMPELPEVPGYGDLPTIPDALLSPAERKAEREAYRSATQQQAEERRAAMQAISKQRREVSEQRRLDWLCSRQAMRPYGRMSQECLPPVPVSGAQPAAPAQQSSAPAQQPAAPAQPPADSNVEAAPAATPAS